MVDYTADFVAATLLPDVPVIKENRSVVRTSLEEPYFRPALKLLVAGLVCGSGPLGKHTLAASFAASTIDHPIMGWNPPAVIHSTREASPIPASPDPRCEQAETARAR